MNSKSNSQSHYFLPSNYRENSANITMDRDEENYWDPVRVERSALHQFDVYKWAEKIIKEDNMQRVMDVGCGFATKLAWLHKRLPKLEYWGIDQPHAVALCKAHYDFGNWLGVNFEEKPEAPPVKADLIISSDVIEHLKEPDLLLEYFRKLIAPNGLILISTPERDALRGPNCLHSPNPYHVREWNRKELAAYFKNQGFEIIEHKILRALRPKMNGFYLRKMLTRIMSGKTMRYNQAVLMRIRKTQ